MNNLTVYHKLIIKDNYILNYKSGLHIIIKLYTIFNLTKSRYINVR